MHSKASVSSMGDKTLGCSLSDGNQAAAEASSGSSSVTMNQLGSEAAAEIVFDVLHCSDRFLEIGT